ncbi:MAG: hypothetical protein ACXAEI_16395, partial [Candidatus Hodarchaeales archaeon]
WNSTVLDGTGTIANLSEIQPTSSQTAAQGTTELAPSDPFHAIIPVSILVYTEFVRSDELNNTITAINTAYGSDYSRSNLTDYANLATKLPDNDILLIPEQERATPAEMKAVGAAWSDILTGFVHNGGIVILLTYGVIWQNFGQTTNIYNESGLLQINEVAKVTPSSTISVVDPNDALARGVASSWPAPNGSLCFNVSEGNNVVDNGTHPLIIHKILGHGHIVLLGFDLWEYELNSARLLGNAIRLHRHAVFDNSHGQLDDIFGNFSSFTDDLNLAGFAVSSMDEFAPTYFNACDVLIITPPSLLGSLPYTAGEVAAIQTFVENGGSLFLLTDAGQNGDALDPLGAPFGFVRDNSLYFRDSDDLVGGKDYWVAFSKQNLVNHSLMVGVGRIEQYSIARLVDLPAGVQTIIGADSDSTATWNDSSSASGTTCLATLSYGEGRVSIAMDSEWLLDEVDLDNDGENNYEDSSNEILAVNTIQWLAATGPKERIVLFDESHGTNWLINTSYTAFADYLTDNGYTVKWMSRFSSDLLDLAHILVISDGTINYTTGELAVIDSFVAAGGGLFLIADQDQWGLEADQVGLEFEIDRNDTGFLQDSDDGSGSQSSYIVFNDSNLSSHPIMQGLSRIELNGTTGFNTIGNGAALVLTDADGTCTWSSGGSANGIATIAATEHQLGRVVYSADADFLRGDQDGDSDGMSNFFDADNNRFVVNAFQWLVENRGPVINVISPNGGETLAQTVTINWTAIDPNKDELTYDLYYRAEGTTWISLASNLTTTEYNWATNDLSDGDQYQVRVVATDEALSGEDTSDNPFIIDNNGPSITNIQHDPVTITITADVVDVSMISSVTINITTDYGITWVNFPMEKGSGNSYYLSTTLYSNGTTLVYYILATDNSTFHHNSVSNPYSFVVQQTDPSTSGPSAGTEESVPTSEDEDGGEFIEWFLYGSGVAILALTGFFLVRYILIKRGKQE